MAFYRQEELIKRCIYCNSEKKNQNYIVLPFKYIRLGNQTPLSCNIKPENFGRDYLSTGEAIKADSIKVEVVHNVLWLTSLFCLSTGKQVGHR